MPTKRALIIGVNKYLYRGEDEQLGGCVNDAKLIRNILINKFNFDPANIVSLYDEQANLEAIQTEMKRLANAIEQDDILVFHFSGHGSQCKITTEYTDEGSGKDNYILPADDSEPTADGPVIWRDVRDHQFNEWLQRIAEKTPYTTLIFDACHSGTMTRGIGGPAAVRGLPPDDRPPVRSAGQGVSRSARATGHPGESGKNEKGAGGWLTLSDNYVVISGCRDTQTSAEDYFSLDGESVKHGLLTYYLTRAILKSQPGTTYRDAFEQVCSGVISQNPGQNPQIEGRVDRELFGVKDIEPLRYIPVTEVDGNTLTLDGGAAHGLRRGSRWAIYPPGAKQEDAEESLGVLQISHVGALSSTGVITERRGAVAEGARCVEVEPVNTADPLQVDVSSLGGDARASIAAGIEESSLLELAGTPETARIRATIVDPARSLPDTVSISAREGVVGPAWAFFENTGDLCMPLHPVDEPGVSSILVRSLEKIARHGNVLRLDNPVSALNVDFNLYKQKPDGELLLANGGNCEFSEGEPMVLELINHETDRPVFFTFIWISASREISQCYPPGKASEELSPGKTVRIGYGEKKLRATLDKDYLADVGSECCKAIFSTRESDFSWLNQEGLRSVGEAASGIAAFETAYRGSDTDTATATATATEEGNQQHEGQRQPGDHWDAVNRSFIVTRSPG